MKKTLFLVAMLFTVRVSAQTSHCDSLQVKYKAAHDSVMTYKVQIQHVKEDCRKASGKYKKNMIYLAGWISRDLR